ncbi:MAG: oligopeptidase B, partial [Gemmataceae bacterium]
MPRSYLVPILLLLAPAFVAADNKAPKPPAAKQSPHSVTLHGDTRVDPFFWLREKSNPEVIKYLEAENAYTAAMTKSTQELEKSLYDEMLGRIKQTDLDVPVRRGAYEYFSRTEKGKQYPIYCRKKVGPKEAEEVLVDANELAKGQKFLSVQGYNVSDDANLLAYMMDTTGFREYHLFVKDLRSGEVLPDRVGKVAGFTWTADNKTVFYVTEDQAKRPHKLWRHVLGTPKDHDALVLEEKDELFRLSVNRSRDKKYVFAGSRSSTSTEVRYLPSDKPTGEFAVVLPREAEHEYSVDHRDGLFYI